MVFASSLFIFLFLPLTLFLYFIAPKKTKNICLLLSSIVFYSWGGLQYTVVLIGSILFNYLIAIIMSGSVATNHRLFKKICLVIAVVFNIGLLFFYKYFNFFFENINSVLSVFNMLPVVVPEIALPIGISFFTFQILSYVIDVYKGKVEVQRNILNLALYVSLFPQLIAGPIVRYIDVENQIKSRTLNVEKLRYGVERFIIGLGKKVFFADTMGMIANYGFDDLTHMSTPLAWLIGIAYSLQIYYDFSAYSDMAIGLGKIFGFDFLENFNYPYISKSVQEFWRRWHISLSTWFRDYLYIPLGGNKVGPVKMYRNLLIVFFVTGLWHGANWTFIVWGLYHGFFLLLEKSRLMKGFLDRNKILSKFYTLIVVMIGWIFFRADTIQQGLYIVFNLFNFNFENAKFVFEQAKFSNMIFFSLAVFFANPRYVYFKQAIDSIKEYNERVFNKVSLFYDMLLIAIFVLEVSFVTSMDFNPFIYFRF